MDLLSVLSANHYNHIDGVEYPAQMGHHLCLLPTILGQYSVNGCLRLDVYIALLDVFTKSNGNG